MGPITQQNEVQRLCLASMSLNSQVSTFHSRLILGVYLFRHLVLCSHHFVCCLQMKLNFPYSSILCLFIWNFFLPIWIIILWRRSSIYLPFFLPFPNYSRDHCFSYQWSGGWGTAKLSGLKWQPFYLGMILQGGVDPGGWMVLWFFLEAGMN